MGTKHNDICLKKAADDEPLFVLRALDPEAPYAVMEWIKSSLHCQPDEKLRAAFEQALKMRGYCDEHSKQSWRIERHLPTKE